MPSFSWILCNHVQNRRNWLAFFISDLRSTLKWFLSQRNWYGSTLKLKISFEIEVWFRKKHACFSEEWKLFQRYYKYKTSGAAQIMSLNCKLIARVSSNAKLIAVLSKKNVNPVSKSIFSIQLSQSFERASLFSNNWESRSHECISFWNQFASRSHEWVHFLNDWAKSLMFVFPSKVTF